MGISTLSTPNKSILKDLDIDLSNEKIMHHLRQLSQKPHPVGSAEHKKARGYIISFLKQQGLSPIELFKMVMSIDMVAPQYGKHRLKEYYIDIRNKFSIIEQR